MINDVENSEASSTWVHGLIKFDAKDGQATYFRSLPPDVNLKEYKYVICPLDGIFNFNKNVINDICTLQIEVDKKDKS